MLSGGGSRGLAHAGVLLGLEDLGYDPDLVVGTSMGALIGALYAAGYEPVEIRDRILSIHWGEMFSPTPMVVGPDREVRHPMLSLDLDIEQLRLSRGLLSQWRINRALVHLLFDANARARGDFNRLARRYRAVAADLRTGEAVVLSQGDLARAARASMATPGFFGPVEWESRVLVDGGIADNLPTATARMLGARSVIAVDVSRPPEDIHSQTPIAVVQRALDLLQENTQRDTVPPDAVIVPEINPSFGGTRFPDDPTPLIRLGLEAAQRDLAPARYANGPGKRPLPVPPDSFSTLVVESPDSALAALARNMFAGVAPGPYDPGRLLTAVDRLYTTGLFEGIWPHVEADSAGDHRSAILRIRLEAPPQISLSAAAGYDNDRGARAWAAVDRFSTFGRRPVVLTAAASILGLERWGTLSARFYTLSRPSLTWSIGAHLQERDVRWFGADALRTTDVLRAGGWLGLEFPHILRDRVGTVSLRAERIRAESGRSGYAIGPLLRFSSLNPELMIVGTPLLVEGEARWGSLPYRRLALRGSRALELSSLHLAAVTDLRLVSSGTPLDLVPALGDAHAIPGLQWGEERGRARLVVGADVAYPVMAGFARLRLRTGTLADEVQQWGASEWVSGAQLGALWQSPLGLVEVGFGLNTLGKRRVDIRLGRSF